MEKKLSIGVEYTDERESLVCRLFLKGKITTTDSYLLQHKLEGEFRKGIFHFVLNMRDVDFLSSSGIRVLLEFFRKTKSEGGTFHVEQPSESVSNVLGMTALDQMLLKR